MTHAMYNGANRVASSNSLQVGDSQMMLPCGVC